MTVPILMYHAIGDPPSKAPIPDLYVSEADFQQQIDYLTANGFEAVTLQRVYDYWHGTGSLPKHPVVISFDDGFQSDYTFVAPLLLKMHWPAVLNLIVGRHKPRMYPSVVRELIADGWEIDSHTTAHEDLPGLSAAQLKYEVVDSRKTLQGMYHIPVNFFCYPSGAFDAAAVAAVRQAGYLGATTTQSGFASSADPYLMRRVRVNRGEDLGTFASSLHSK